MPESYLFNDFSGGWQPNNNWYNSPKNAFLRFTGVELDETGSLRLVGAIKSIFNISYPARAHTLFSVFFSGSQFRYLALESGHVYRETTMLNTNGSLTRAAFFAAFDQVFIWSGAYRARDQFGTISDIGLTTPGTPTVALSGAGELVGDYEYAQMAVNDHGNGYVAKSRMSPVSTTLTADHSSINVTPAAIPAGSTSAWIFRRGGFLEQWYRIKTVTSTALFNDNLSDLDAKNLNITANEFLFPTNVAGIPDNVLEVVGLINGRVILFTASSIYFSSINSPDNYDSRHVIKLASGERTGTEIFLWARKMDKDTVVIGTNKDVYILTGTFKEFPDGYLDVYLTSLAVDTPPLSQDACVYNNSVVYMSENGWAQLALNEQIRFLCPPFTDRLYRGETLAGYEGVPIYIFPSPDASGNPIRYSCAIGRNKLYCRVPRIMGDLTFHPFKYRLEVFDFIRNYWRTMDIAPDLLYAGEDSEVIAMFSDGTGHRLKEIDRQIDNDKTNDGTPHTISIMTPFHDAGTPYNRKDLYTMKMNVFTKGSNILVELAKNDDFVFTPVAEFATDTMEEKVIHLYELMDKAKNWQIRISGPVRDFQLASIEFIYDIRPRQQTAHKILNKYYGPNKRKINTWPIIIDTLGSPVKFTPSIDNIDQPYSTFTTDEKTTVFHHFLTDFFGIDYSGVLESQDPSVPFELYDFVDPEFSQSLPVSKRVDQIGPVEIFRYGKLRKFEIRLIAFGGTGIPYTIYFDETVSSTETLPVVDGKELVYEINVPKTVAGSVIKIKLGPTDFDFHRIYTRVLVARGGADTDLQWLPLEESQIQ